MHVHSCLHVTPFVTCWQRVGAQAMLCDHTFPGQHWASRLNSLIVDSLDRKCLPLEKKKIFFELHNFCALL